MPSPFGPVFEKTFTQLVVQFLLGVLQKAYQTAREHHKPEHGSNAKTFGYCLYEYLVHELAKTEGNGPLTIAWDKGVFRFVIGEYVLAIHKAGHTGKEDIKTSFPNNDGAIGQLIPDPSAQGWLPGIDVDDVVDEINLREIRKGTLIHMGNPEDGACALYFCVPMRRDQQGKIIEWAGTELLWMSEAVRASLMDFAISADTSDADLPKEAPEQKETQAQGKVPEEEDKKALPSRKNKRADLPKETPEQQEAKAQDKVPEEEDKKALPSRKNKRKVDEQ